MNQRPDFVNRSGDELTPDGQKLQAFIEGMFTEADQKNDIVALNGVLSGHIGHYYTNVYKLGMMTPERWMKDFSESFAAAAWRDMQWFVAQEAQTQKVAETSEQTTNLAEQLTQLQAQLAEALGKIQVLEEAQAEPEKPKRKPRKAKVVEVVDEPPDDETDETESDETEDASEEA